MLLRWERKASNLALNTRWCRLYYYSPGPVPEFIDPVFTKTSPKRSFSLNRKRAFWLVFTKTGSIFRALQILVQCVWFRRHSREVRLTKKGLLLFYRTRGCQEHIFLRSLAIERSVAERRKEKSLGEERGAAYTQIKMTGVLSVENVSLNPNKRMKVPYRSK